MKCSQCGKGPATANRISISRSQVSGRSKRWQKPNVMKRRLMLDGMMRTVSISRNACGRETNENDRLQINKDEHERAQESFPGSFVVNQRRI